MSNTVIYHRADYDGKFSGAICALFVRPELENVIGWDYGDPLIEFPDTEKVYLVDLSPDCFKGIPNVATQRLIWIDHHKSSIQKWDDELGHPFQGYRIDGVAACRLCWQWFWKEYQDWQDVSSGNHPMFRLPTKEEFIARSVSEPLSVRLAGEYDVWDHRDYRALDFQYGLTIDHCDWPENPYSIIRLLGDADKVSRELADHNTIELAEAGRMARLWQEQFAESVIKDRCYIREFEGIKFAVLASSHVRNSMWFPDRALPNEAEALMAWRYDGNVVSFSLYHRPRHEHHDLSQIAVKYGGGGHKGACGFQLPLDEALEIVR